MANVRLLLGTLDVNSFGFRTPRDQSVTLRNRGTVQNLRQPAVGAFVTAACQRLGSQDKLAVWLTLEGYSVRRPAISRWVTGDNDPPAWVLFHIASELGLSLDEFALGHPRDLSLAQRLLAIEVQVAVLVERAATEDRQAIERPMTSDRPEV
jgi:hypothetical protein